ncbi:hypothetical protein GGR66_000778 [Xanthomonas sp. 3498]|nr:hypothetical protein [Xanthomonas sp. 3498]
MHWMLSSLENERTLEVNLTQFLRSQPDPVVSGSNPGDLSKSSPGCPVRPWAAPVPGRLSSNRQQSLGSVAFICCAY